MSTSTKLTRREMLQRSALAGAGLWLGGSAQAESASPNEKLNIACIGLGNQGQANLGLVSSQNIVGLCDVDSARTDKYQAKHPRAKSFADFRVMLDKLENQIDAVVVTTPNHTHATIAINAMRRGKHVYCEKPLAHTIHEIREMQRVAREEKVVTQMGTQNHAGDNYRRTVELIRSGAIGDVKQVHVWFGRPGGWRRYKHVVDRPTEPQPIPKTLNWDLWVGPARCRIFIPAIIPTTGTTGGTSATARWATWAAITWT